jgi:ADP-ribose pyrophosphatase YjhB (NUDIX family)
MDADILLAYGNRLRVRACGLCWSGKALLMVNHRGLGQEPFWAPPGGEVMFGHTLAHTIEREILEETGMQVSCGPFRFAGEFIQPPLHAIELFFDAELRGGTLRTGFDPEVANGIREVRFMLPEEIQALPPRQKHGLFRYCSHADDLIKLTGFYRF